MSFFEISSILLWLVVLGNLLLTLVIIRNISMGSATPIETLKKGTTVPNFQAQSVENGVVTYDDFMGKTLVLVFISPSCGHCRPAINEIEDLNASSLNPDFKIIFICDGDMNQTKAFANEINITLPIFSASRAENPFLTDFKIGGVPSYVIIDSERKVHSAGVYQDHGWKDFMVAFNGREG